MVHVRFGGAVHDAPPLGVTGALSSTVLLVWSPTGAAACTTSTIWLIVSVSCASSRTFLIVYVQVYGSPTFVGLAHPFVNPIPCWTWLCASAPDEPTVKNAATTPSPTTRRQTALLAIRVTLPNPLPQLGRADGAALPRNRKLLPTVRERKG